MASGDEQVSAVVCVTPVMDTSSPVDFAALVTGRGPYPERETPGLSWILNPADEAAVHMAADLPGSQGHLLALHVGSPLGEKVLRDALAYGASRAVRLELPPDEAVEAPAVAEAIAGYVRESPPDWVVCGQATLDWGNGVVGPAVAELLDWPLVDQILEIHADPEGTVRCLRVLGRGRREEVRVRAPAVLAVSPMAFRTVPVPVRARLQAQRAAVPSYPAPVSRQLHRPVRREATRPRPRPKAALPTEFGLMSADQRLSFLLQSGRPATSAARWLEGDAGTIACQLLDFIVAAGYDVRR